MSGAAAARLWTPSGACAPVRGLFRGSAYAENGLSKPFLGVLHALHTVCIRSRMREKWLICRAFVAETALHTLHTSRAPARPRPRAHEYERMQRMQRRENGLSKPNLSEVMHTFSWLMHTRSSKMACLSQISRMQVSTPETQDFTRRKRLPVEHSAYACATKGGCAHE